MVRRYLFRRSFKAGFSTIVIVIILFIGGGHLVFAENENSDIIKLNFSFLEPAITQINISNITYDQVSIEGLPNYIDPGIPILPMKPVKIQLPQKSIFESVNITCIGNISLGYGFNIELGPEFIESSNEGQNTSNISINFDPLKPYPTKLVSDVNVYKFRGYSFLVFTLYPIHYVKETGELYYFQQMTVTINTCQNGSINPLFRNLKADKMVMKEIVHDFHMMNSYNTTSSPFFNSSIVDDSESYDYVIITNATLKNATGNYTFQELMDYKNARGIKTTLVTVEDIITEPEYWNTSNPMFNDTEAMIRNFIIDAYTGWGIEYVLLGGDYECIPARVLYAIGVSDFYYACLDGSFNHDEDYFWGEAHDGENGNEVDFFAEVYVGRACVDNSEEVSNFVRKTIAYENTFDSYLNKVLMLSEYVDGYCKNYSKRLIDGWSDTVGIPSTKYNITEIYDEDYKPDSWNKSEVISRINNGTHIINHIGHSSDTSNMRMGIEDVEGLTNDKYCFIYSQGCYPGKFYIPGGGDCIAEYFTVKSTGGAFAGIWNSYKGYPRSGESQDYNQEFWDAVFGENISELGRANQDSKEDRIIKNDWDRVVCFELNFFGDPQVSIKPTSFPEHDISVNCLDINDYDRVPSDEVFTVNAFIENKGLNNETNITINFNIDGATEDNTTINLTRGDATIISFNVSLNSGLHQIGVGIPPDFNNNTKDNVTGNNFINVTVIAGPDISVMNLDISPPLYINCNTELNITIGNLGTNDVADINLSLLIDDEVVNETSISSLSSGKLVVISLGWIPQNSTWNNLTIFATPVTEENYTINNYYNMSIHPVNHTVYVDDSGNAEFETIQDAIDWIGDGDTIYVYNGMYNESVKVYKAINLIGEDKNSTIIDGNGTNDPVVKIYNADGVNLTGFKLQNNCSTAVEIRSNYNNISSNIITTPLNSTEKLSIGIDIYSDNNMVFQNYITNISSIGIRMESDDNVISENMIENVACIGKLNGGIVIGKAYLAFQSGSFNKIIGNKIMDSKYGLKIMHKYNVISDNLIINSTEIGILLSSSYNNAVNNNVSSNLVGVKTSSFNNTISENKIFNNSIGIKQSWGKDNLFIGNNISYNDEGVNITSTYPSNNNTFYYNNFINNSINAYDECNNYWDNGSVGNYWNDFDEPSEGAYDNDSDGIVDSPYNIPGGNNQDRYPLINVSTVSDIKPNKPEKPDGTTVGHIYMKYRYNTSTTDPDDNQIYYLWNWYDETKDVWIGPNATGDAYTFHHWNERGTFYVRVKAKDTFGLESDWSDPLVVEIENRPPNKTKKPILVGLFPQVGEPFSIMVHNTTDPDGDEIYYRFDWGDGTWSGWIQQAAPIGGYTWFEHVWNKKGKYEIRVKAKDDPNGDGDLSDGMESPWSDPKTIIVCFTSNVITVQKTVVHKSVQFNCSASNGTAPYSYNLDFGDGNYSQSQNSTHTYTQTGFYTINLTVTDDKGYTSNCIQVIEVVILMADFKSSSNGYSKTYVTIYFNDSSESYYNIVNWTWDFDDGNISYEQNTSHNFTTDGIYNVTLNITDSESNTDIYYQIIYIDSVQPEIESVSDSTDTVGFGFGTTITTNTTDDNSGVKTASVNVTYPDNSYSNYTMNNIENNTYEYVFSDTWLVGQYNYTVWVFDNSNNSNSSSGHCFNVSAQADISVCTIKDSYGNNENIDITDPPGGPPLVGYELLDNGNVLHMWNKHNSYYFNTSSGIQLTNHYDEYWSHNVLMLGYYNNDEWNLIYRTDELSGFNKDIDTDNETFVNATLWKDLTYKGYDFRLAIRYNLGVNDPDLTVIPYIKNIDDEYIPYALAFGWEIKDIKIADTVENDTIRLYNGTDWISYNLNQTLDNKYTDMDYNTTFILEGRNEGKYFRRTLYLRWNHTLDYLLKVKSREGQYNAPVTLFIKIGTLAKSQEKYTMMNWLDSDSWLGISSSELAYACENKFGLGMALDGTGELWDAVTNHDHEFILNLGKNYSIKKFRGRSISLKDPIDVDIYISTDNSTWGTAVASDISTWQDTDTWVEVDSTDKTGQYIKVVVQATEDEARILAWGGFMPPGPIFDVYGEEIAAAPEVSNPYPADGSTGVSLTPTLNITVFDANGDSMNITWFSNSSGSWQVFGTNNSVTDGTYRQTYSNATENGKWWYWKVNVTDGTNYTVSSVYKFYTGYQSKIDNTGSTSIKGYLLIQIQFYNTTSSTWVVANDTINETTTRTIHWDDPYGDQQPILALDTIFNGLVNTNDLTYGNGTYRVYAAFRDPDGNILKCDDETELVATYEFTITFA